MKKLFIACILFGLSSSSWAAVCIVTEHMGVPNDPQNRTIPIALFPPLTAPQSVTYTTTTATGNAFQSLTRYIGFICNATAHFEVATEGTATATVTDPWVPANTWLFIGVTGGLEIAFYDGSS